MGVKFMQPSGVRNFKSFGITLTTGIQELLDNSRAANAENAIIALKQINDKIALVFIDNGKGMSKETIPYALSFGGEDNEIGIKGIEDYGKFHAGLTITALTFSKYTEILSNNGEGWYKSYLNESEIEKTMEVPDAVECELPELVKEIIKDVESHKGINIGNTGTVVIFHDVVDKIISPGNIKNEVNALYNEICIKSFQHIIDGMNIDILLNSIEDFRSCEPVDPLLNHKETLDKYKLEIIAHFKYEKILEVKDILPYSETNGSIGIEFVLIKKKPKCGLMKNAPEMIKLNMENQGISIARLGKVIDRAMSIGFERHNDFNGLRAYINTNGVWDEVLGITVNKSVMRPMPKFNELLDQRLRVIFTHCRKILRRNGILEPPAITIDAGRECEPIIFLDKTNSTGITKKTTNENENVPIQIPIPLGTNNGIPKPSISTGVGNYNGNAISTPTVTTNRGNNEENSDTNGLKQKDTVNTINVVNLPNDILSNKIIFAAKQKPDLTLYNISDKNTKVQLTENDDKYLIYDSEIDYYRGVTKLALEEWWTEKGKSIEMLYKKMRSSISEKAEMQLRVFDFYYDEIYVDNNSNYVLFPEVYTNLNTINGKNNIKQCVDFMIILPNKEKIIIEIDGIGHYAEKIDNKWIAKPKKYSDDRVFDRDMTLNGYKVYRFGNEELKNDNYKELLREFFSQLLKKQI